MLVKVFTIFKRIIHTSLDRNWLAGTACSEWHVVSFRSEKIPIGGFLMAHSQTILITGATSGIGRYQALRLAAAGHRIFATGRGQTALDALRTEAAGKGLRLETVLLDVTNSASIDAARY